jgi:hypothetical protein
MLDACPSYATKWMEIEAKRVALGEERLHYIDAGHLIRHMVELRQQNRTEEFDGIFRAVERMVAEGDEYVSNLGVVGYLEGMQMRTVTDAGIDPDAEFRPRLGPRSVRWWDWLNRSWAGDWTPPPTDDP